MSLPPDVDDEADTCVIDAGDDLIDTQEVAEHDPGREQATTDLAHEAIVMRAPAPAAGPAASGTSAHLRPRRSASIRRARRKSSSISVQGVVVIMLVALAMIAMIVATRLF